MFVFVKDYNEIINDCQMEVFDRFTSKKEQSLILADAYLALEEPKKSFRVYSCGDFLEFVLSSDGTKKLYRANFCKDRLCPMCNWRRSLKIFSQVSSVMDVLQKDYRFLFLTLTVKNCKFDELEETISALLDGWRFLYRQFRNKGFSSIVGTFRTIEITVNKQTQTFHPHIHCIVAVSPSYFKNQYKTQKEWSEIWQNCCNLDYAPIIDIRTVKAGRLDDVSSEDKGMLYKSALKEVAKYSSKGSDYLVGEIEELLPRVYHLMTALAGRRLVSMTGVFLDVAKRLRLDDPEDGDLVHVEGEQLRPDLHQMMMRFHWTAGGYVGEVVENE